MDANLYALKDFHIPRVDIMHHRKVTAALAIAALMTLAVVTAGCTTNTSPSPTPTPVVQTITKSGKNTTLTSTAGFKITFPSVSKYEENGSTPVKVYIYLNPQNSVTGVNVATQAVTESATLDSLTTYYTNQLLNYQNVTFVLKPANATLDGQPAKTIIYRGTVPVQYTPTVSRNTTLQAQQTWIINNGTTYLVTYKAPVSDYREYQSEAKEIISSFQLT